MRGIVDAERRKRLQRLLFAVVAVGFLTMPVEYRGGAAIAHPHAIYQFWVDAARGTMDHHLHDRGAKAAHPDGSHVGSGDVPTGDEPTVSGLAQPGAGLFALTIALALMLTVFGPGVPSARWNAPLKAGRLPSPAVPPP